MKIQIWCEGQDLHGKHLTDVVTARVPTDINIVDSKACKEILERRRKRIGEANRYREKYNRQFKNSIERNIFGKKILKERLYTIHIRGWSPIITRDALEFICGRL